MFRVGLTGGIASGKSTVARLFADRGIPIIDSDEIARDVVRPGSPLLAKLAEVFGREILAEDGSLDRATLRKRVFASDADRLTLQSLLHPAIRAEMETRSSNAGGPYQILAIPLLVEGGRVDHVDRVLVVDVDEEIQLLRVQARDGSTRAEADAILRAQATRSARLAVAHDVIRNEGTLDDLTGQVDVLHAKYLELAAAQESTT